jgi:hypothetical protein
MKKSGILGVVVFMILFCAASYAQDLRVVVMPFEDRTGKADGPEALTGDIIKEVKSSGAFAYVPPRAMAERWISREGSSGRKVPGTFAENPDRALRFLKPMFAHDDLGTIAAYKDLWGADLVVMSELRESGGALRMRSEIISIDTGRFYEISGDCPRDRIKEELLRQVRALLNMSASVRQAGSDRQIDPEASVVAYDIKTEEGEDLWMITDYTGRRPDPELQNMDITPQRALRDGVKTLTVQTDTGRPIEFQYYYKAGERVSVNISVPPPAGQSGAEYEETLTITSKGGYVIRFVFYWKGGELKGVRAEPVVNPFSEVKDI